MDNSDSYRPHEIDLRHIKIMNSQGNFIELRDVILEMNIYHDLFTYGVKCDLIIADGLGLIERLPIVGDEFVYIDFNTPGQDKRLQYVFQVYKLDQRIKHKERAESYVLHCVSPETMNSLKQTVEVPYSNMSPSDIIESVYTNYLSSRSQLMTFNKTLDISPTDNMVSFIAMHNPYKVIEYMTKLSFSQQYASSLFRFYETSQGWNFKPIEELIAASIVDSFYYTPTDTEEGRQNNPHPDNSLIGQIKPYQKIVQLEYNNFFDTIRNYNNGLYSNRWDIIDTLRKTRNIRSFTYDEDFDRLLHLHPHTLSSAESQLGVLDSNDSVSQHLIYSELGDNYPQTAYINQSTEGQTNNPYEFQRFAEYRTGKMAELDTVGVTVVLPGNSDLEIGDVINLYSQQSAQDEGTMSRNSLLLGENDPKFLITKIRHTYNKESNNYSTVAYCIKDSFAITPTEQNNDSR